MAFELELLVDYFDHACVFERLAIEEANHGLRDLFREHARAYRKLVADSIAALGLPA